ncbi:MAG: hypothetical protein R3F20_07030 [Planctomycetota bacterium]
MSELDQILALLDEGEAELRSAAALVLGRLRPVTPRALEALRRALAAAGTGDAAYFLDALAATRLPEVVPDLLPFLERPGSPGEQAVRLVRGFGAAALDRIAARHEDVPGWRSGAYVKTVAGIHDETAVRMLVERLDAATWDQARATSICMIENFDAYPEAAQRLLADAVRARLDDPEADRDAFAVTTCFRLAQHLPLDVPPESILRFLEEDRILPIRRHAIQALGGFVLDDEELGRARRALHALLFEADYGAIVRPALEVLEAWRDRGVPRDELREVAASPHAFAVRYALETLLAQHPGEEREIFEAQVEARFPQVREVALRGILACPGGREDLARRLRETTDVHLAREIAERLADRADGASPELVDEMRRDYLRGLAAAEAETLVDFLAREDREGFNAFLTAWAREALEAGRAAEVIARLQPLVRLRHADEENRYLLALANLRDARALDLEDGRFRRGVDLLAPLARTWGYSLSDRANADDALPPETRMAVAAALFARGEVERREGLAMLAPLDRPDVDPALADRRDALRRAAEE